MVEVLYHQSMNEKRQPDI